MKHGFSHEFLIEGQQHWFAAPQFIAAHRIADLAEKPHNEW